MRELFFICNQYPMNYGDSAFISTEIEYLKKVFPKITILALTKKDSYFLSDISASETISYYFLSEFRKNYLNIFFNTVTSKYLYREISYLLNQNDISLKKCIYLFIYLLRSNHIKNVINIILKHSNKDIIYYSYWHNNGTLAAALLKKKNDIFVSRIHGYDLYKFRNKYNYQPYKVQVDSIIDKIYFISKIGMEYYMNNFSSGEHANKYIISYLGVENNNTFKNVTKISNKVRIISCSMNIKLKRINYIIKALSQIDNISISWEHIGDGPELENNIKYATELLNNNTNIEYKFLGRMNNEDIINYYFNNDFDCFISASETEGLPVSMMEAFSAGLPVISYDVGGVSELVDDKTGYLISDINRYECLCESIIKLNKLNQEEFQLMRLSAYKKWKEYFSAEKNYSNFAFDIYNARSRVQ